MRITDYKNKIFNYSAGVFRRLADFLSVEPAKNDNFSNENLSPALTDWLEKTRNISPEQWMNFSGESVADSEIEFTDTDSTDVKSSKNIQTAARSESIPKIEILSEKKSPKRFLIFKKKTEKPVQQTAEPAKPANKNLSVPTAESKNFFVRREKKSELQTPQLVLPTENLLKKTPETETNILVKVNAESKKIELSKTVGVSEPEKLLPKSPKKNWKIIAEKIFLNPPKELKPETMEKEFAVSEQNLPNDFIFRSNEKNRTETPIFQIEKEKTYKSAESSVLKDKQKKTEAEVGIISAKPPWIDLPEVFLFDEFETAEKIRTAERLIFLEREQEN